MRHSSPQVDNLYLVVLDPRRLIRRILPAPEPETVGAVLAEIQWAQARLLGPGDYAAGARAQSRRTPLPVDEIAEIYSRYGEAKRTHGVIDLNDLLTRCADLLEGVAAAPEREQRVHRHHEDVAHARGRDRDVHRRLRRLDGS